MRIYLFRGLLGSVFSTGMDTLSTKLKEDGHIVSVHPWFTRVFVEREARKIKENIAVVGHSLGANSANYMANNLANVKYVVLFDVTNPKRLKGKYGFNFISKDFRAKSINGITNMPRKKLSHTEIDKDKDIHSFVIAYFREMK